MSVQQTSAQNRKVGLDKPCGMCSGTIYFSYCGPIEGICGKCTDDLRSRLGTSGAGNGPTIRRTRVSGYGLGTVIFAFLGGAAAAAIVFYSGVLLSG